MNKTTRFFFSPSRDRISWRAPSEPLDLLGKDDDWRPLVVIDPGDREQVELLLETYGRQFTDWTPELDTNVTRLQDALRSLTAPKPPEPTGRYAVVVDVSGDEWIRTAEDPPAPWLQSGYFTAEQWTEYADILAVRVLFEGVAS